MDRKDKIDKPPARCPEKLSHAYIAPDPGTADALALAAICTGTGVRPCGACRDCVKAARGLHPDIITIGLLPDKREILVDQIRAVKEDVIVVPNESEKKVYIIRNAESMNRAAQNALLRVLEEPPGHAMFILIAENNPAELLPTVRSRCAVMRGRPELDAGDEGYDTANGFFKALEGGAYALTDFAFKLDKLEKTELAAFLDAARKLTVRKLRESPPNRISQLPALLPALSKADDCLQRNVAAPHIGGLLLASLLQPDDYASNE